MGVSKTCISNKKQPGRPKIGWRQNEMRYRKQIKGGMNTDVWENCKTESKLKSLLCDKQPHRNVNRWVSACVIHYATEGFCTLQLVHQVTLLAILSISWINE